MRGSYRSVYSAIFNEEDFVALGRAGQQLWFVLRHRLGLSGIDVVTVGELEVFSFAEGPEEVRELLELLERERWIRVVDLGRGRLLVWMRNALRWEPHASLGSASVVTGVLRQIRRLPRDPLLLVYLDHYQRHVGRHGRDEWSALRKELAERLEGPGGRDPLPEGVDPPVEGGDPPVSGETPTTSERVPERVPTLPDTRETGIRKNRKTKSTTAPTTERSPTASDLRVDRANTKKSQKRGKKELADPADPRIVTFRAFVGRLFPNGKRQELLTQVLELPPTQRDAPYEIASDYLAGDIPNDDMARRLFVAKLNACTNAQAKKAKR